MKYRRLLLMCALAVSVAYTINALLEGFPLWFTLKQLIPNYVITFIFFGIVYLLLRLSETRKQNDMTYKNLK